MTISIRAVEGEERIATSRVLTRYAFEASPRPIDLETERRWPGQGTRRTHVLFDDDEPRCTASVIDMTQNVRGVLLPMGAVAGVASHPEARRGGLARQLVTYLLADMRDQGQPVSALYPFRATFYEKFGYLGLGPERQATLKPADLAPLLRATVPGEVRLHPYAEAAESVRAITEAVQRDTHGMALRADPGLEKARANEDQWAALATVDGEPVGYLAYRIKRYAGELAVWRFLYRDPAARTLLLGWLARHVDQVSAISLPLRPIDRPEHWITDADIRVESRMSPLHRPAPMARILSVPGLSGLGTGPGEICVRIVDDLIGGVYTFASDGKLSVVDGGTPAAELTSHGLAALVYGVIDPAELPLRGFGTVSDEAAARLREIFPPAAPFLLESF